jgi:hypothetical protein
MKGVPRGVRVELATPAQIARALRSKRAKLGWINRRIREAERLCGQIEQWRKLRAQFGDAIGDFERAA